MGTRCADHVTPLYPQKLALTSPTGGGRSVGIVRSRTKATEFFLLQDESKFVRRRFVEKLCQRLKQQSLPTTFISYFVLADLEQDADIKSSMLHALNLCVQYKRRRMWSLINVTRGSILIIPKMAYLRAISQQIGLIYSKKLYIVQCQCILYSSNCNECQRHGKYEL